MQNLNIVCYQNIPNTYCTPIFSHNNFTYLKVLLILLLLLSNLQSLCHLYFLYINSHLFSLLCMLSNKTSNQKIYNLSYIIVPYFLFLFFINNNTILCFIIQSLIWFFPYLLYVYLINYIQFFLLFKLLMDYLSIYFIFSSYYSLSTSFNYLTKSSILPVYFPLF